MERITVVKIGGNVIDNPAAMKRFLKEFAALEGPKILVHGGGKLATRLAERLELKVQMVDGRRITDKGTLDVVTMVYAGLINKQAVAGLQAAGCNALGLSGADGNAAATYLTGDRGFCVQNVFLNAGKSWTIKGTDSMSVGVFTNLIWNPALDDVNFVGGISFRM